MKAVIKTAAVLLLVMILAGGVPAAAQTVNAAAYSDGLSGGNGSQPQAFGFNDDMLKDAVPTQAADILNDSGISPTNNGAGTLSLESALSLIWDMLCENAVRPLRLLCSLCGIVLLCALSGTAAENAGGAGSVFTAVAVLAGAGMTTAAVAGVLEETMTLLRAASSFMLVFIPAFAGIVTAMGKVTAASAANAVTLAATQLFSQLAVNFLTPLCGAVLGLSVTGSIHPELNLSKLGEFIRKAVVWALSLLMTVFMSILSAQTFVSNSADNVLIRTAKFAVSSGVPIVGGTISDAVNTVSGSLSLLHGSVGTFGIAAGMVMILPTLLTVACYRLAMSAAEAVSEVFGTKELSALFKSCGDVMAIILAVIVCFLLMNIIAAVIMLVIGSGVG